MSWNAIICRIYPLISNKMGGEIVKKYRLEPIYDRDEQISEGLEKKTSPLSQGSDADDARQKKALGRRQKVSKNPRS